MIGIAKLRPHSEWQSLFAEIGFGQWFRYVTGIIQLVGALLFLVPRAAMIGGALLAATMGGATLLHLFILDSGLPGAMLTGVASVIIVAITLNART
jgi:hypothetical protein